MDDTSTKRYFAIMTAFIIVVLGVVLTLFTCGVTSVFVAICVLGDGQC